MLKSLVIYFGKKYAISFIQDAVKSKSPEVAAWATRVAGWASYATTIVAFLNALAHRLADGELTDQEAKDSIAEAKQIAEEFSK